MCSRRCTRLTTFALVMMRGAGSKKKRRISGVIATSSVPRRSTCTRVSRSTPTPLPSTGTRSPRSASPVSSSSREPSKREVVLGQPFQEGGRLGEQVARHRSGRHFELACGSLQALQHGLPVGDDNAHLVEDGRQGVGEIARLAVGQGLDMDGDIAFLASVAPVPVAHAGNLEQAAGSVAPGLEDGMQQQTYGQSARLQLGHHRVDQEGHVVVDDLDDGPVRRRAVGLDGRAADAHFVPALGPGGDELQRLARVAGEPGGRQPFQVGEAFATVEQRHERGGLRALAQHLLHLPDQAVPASFRVERHFRFPPTASWVEV